ncbi:hypothetical protein [Chitinophaga nivalis]|uniref:Beta-lactamase-inhibitor-like PepSY-like domain-containing protein n=1 Tax=Chitinophaga nivalis TaxID=2991709 RepID=A0ABT3IUM2_9BACT|nr:hypothetical protein [Chitinophaga nivalis]MCW3462684.1 hypothetical protein [Chitinophaga nivalis]MCW3487625.1 hypothetical protein [Chitinophaga nivalis]
MKKLILLLSAAFLLSAQTIFAHAYETAVNSKIASTFNESFTGAKEVKWYTEDNKTFTAKFTMSNTKVSAFFDDNGNLLATSRYLQPEQLPLEVTNKLNKKYAGNSIFCVVEYTAEANTAYIITLEGKDHWTTVKAAPDGTMKLQNRMKKA